MSLKYLDVPFIYTFHLSIRRNMYNCARLIIIKDRDLMDLFLRMIFWDILPFVFVILLSSIWRKNIYIFYGVRDEHIGRKDIAIIERGKGIRFARVFFYLFDDQLYTTQLSLEIELFFSHLHIVREIKDVTICFSCTESSIF